MTEARSLPQIRVALGVTGASGIIYAEALALALLAAGIRTYLVFTETARKVIATESPHGLLAAVGQSALRAGFENAEDVVKAASGAGLAAEALQELRSFPNDDLYAPLASGSSGATHMIVCPCSMGTLSRIAHGTSGNLLERSADVMLKERRPLIVVPRETPLNLIHLQNMTTLLQAGAHLIPASPGFYHQPRSIADLVEFMTDRVLDALRLEEGIFKKRVRWNPRLL